MGEILFKRKYDGNINQPLSLLDEGEPAMDGHTLYIGGQDINTDLYDVDHLNIGRPYPTVEDILAEPSLSGMHSRIPANQTGPIRYVPTENGSTFFQNEDPPNDIFVTYSDHDFFKFRVAFVVGVVRARGLDDSNVTIQYRRGNDNVELRRMQVNIAENTLGIESWECLCFVPVDRYDAVTGQAIIGLRNTSSTYNDGRVVIKGFFLW